MLLALVLVLALLLLHVLKCYCAYANSKAHTLLILVFLKSFLVSSCFVPCALSTMAPSHLLLVLLLAPIGLARGKATKASAPVVSWTQRAGTVMFKIPLKGCSEVSAEILRATVDGVTVTCGSTKVNVELRRDIVPGESTCAGNVFGVVECVLRKAFPVAWDRLTWTEEREDCVLSPGRDEGLPEESCVMTGGIPGYSMNDLDDGKYSGVAKSIFDEYANSTVNLGAVAMTGAQLRKATATAGLVVVQVELPWCEACRPSTIAMGQVAGEFRKEIAAGKVVIGHVNAAEERSVARKFKVGCGECMIHVHSKYGGADLPKDYPKWGTLDASWSKVRHGGSMEGGGGRWEVGGGS